MKDDFVIYETTNDHVNYPVPLLYCGGLLCFSSKCQRSQILVIAMEADLSIWFLGSDSHKYRCIDVVVYRRSLQMERSDEDLGDHRIVCHLFF